MSILVPNKSKLLVPDRLRLGGIFKCKLLRGDGSTDEWETHNLIVNQGLDHILGVEFTGVTQITSWYLAPFAGNYSPVATDTASTISANATESTAYTSSTRVAYTGVEGSQACTNSAAPATFTFNASASLYGAFLVSAPTKGSTSGTLFAAAQFNSLKSVSSGDQLIVTYGFSAASA
jgi:hypothetical protein